MRHNLKIAVFFITIFLYGFPSHSKLSTKGLRPHRILLRNQRIHRIYFHELQRSTKAFRDIERLKSCPKQCRWVKKRQFYKGIPVFGSRIIEKSLGNKKVVTMGRKANLYDMGVLPYLSREQSLEIVGAETKREFSNAQLAIYPTKDQNHLVWMMDENATNSQLRVFLDAQKGNIVDYYNNIAYLGEVEGSGTGILGNEQFFNIIFNDDLFQMISLAPPVRTYEFEGGGLPGRKITSVSPLFDHPSGVDVQSYTQKFLQLLKERFNRLSYDDAGSPIVNTVNFYDTDLPGKMYYSAYWHRKKQQVVYGIGERGRVLPLSGALDIVAHEITHAITEKTSELLYLGESGALNEAFSDIMATYTEHKLYPESADWKIGEDIYTPNILGDALRYMNDPRLDGKSRDHYQNLYIGNHNVWGGGVHINSGIANLAFYLLVNGGVHPRRPTSHRVNGIGWERAIDIFYKAFTEGLGINAKFIDAREATVLVARDYDQQTVRSVMQAWAAVGVGNIDDEDPNGENGPPIEEEYSEVLASSIPNIKIPDKNLNGVKDQLEVVDQVALLAISVDIKHTYQGDLVVQVISPRSKTYTLHWRSGRSQDDLKKTYEVKLSSSDSSVGYWTLQVSDRSNRHTGTLQSWSISRQKK